MSQDRAFVLGVGMTAFARCDTDVKQLGQSAARDALADADLSYDAVEQAYCGYVNGMSTLGQQSLSPRPELSLEQREEGAGFVCAFGEEQFLALVDRQHDPEC